MLGCVRMCAKHLQHPLVNLEMYEIESALAVQGMTSVRNYFDLRVLIKSPGRRYRLLLVMTFAWFGQFSGNNIASYYLPMVCSNRAIYSSVHFEL